MDGGACIDTGWAPQCGHNKGQGCNMVSHTGPFELNSYNYGGYHEYQIWHCDEVCEDLRYCEQCEIGVAYRVGCGGTEEGQCVSCKQCGPGTYLASGCITDFYQDVSYDTLCAQCDAGSYSDEENIKVCKDCPEGSYSDVGSSTCTQCSPGTYQEFAVTSYCDACAEGTYQPNSGASSCIPCDECQAGFYRVGCSASSPGECSICTNTI
jgi:hypothetical protein